MEIKRPKNLEERQLRISQLHIFDLYLFQCCLYTSIGQIWKSVTNVERQDDTIILTFEGFSWDEDFSTDAYAIIDDEEYLVAQRYLDSEKHYKRGEAVRLSFEVSHDSNKGS